MVMVVAFPFRDIRTLTVSAGLRRHFSLGRPFDPLYPLGNSTGDAEWLAW
jgi:hypothetical protein